MAVFPSSVGNVGKEDAVHPAGKRDRIECLRGAGIELSDLNGNATGNRHAKEARAPVAENDDVVLVPAPPSQRPSKSATVCGVPPVASIFLIFLRMHIR